MGNNYCFRDWYIPGRMMDAIHRYVEHGIEPGDFLCAVIDNDLREAVGRADDENLHNLPAFVAYFYNEAPSPCWGSPEKRRSWVWQKREGKVVETEDGQRVSVPHYF